MDCDNNYFNNQVLPKEKKSVDKITSSNIESNKVTCSKIIEDDNIPQNIKNDRCHVCNKKLRTCGIECKCKKFFCFSHISNTNHNCSFDYKEFGKNLVEKQNPRILFDKV